MIITSYSFLEFTLWAFETNPGAPEILALQNEERLLSECHYGSLRVLYELVKHAPKPVPKGTFHSMTPGLRPKLSRLSAVMNINPPPWRARNGEYAFQVAVRKVDVVPRTSPAARHLLALAATESFRPPGPRTAVFEPVVHTLSLAHFPGKKEWYEMRSQESSDGREHRINDLTGYGETKAVQLLQSVAHECGNQIVLRPVVAAAEIGTAQALEHRLRQHAIIWLGSPFNENHGLNVLLKRNDFWEAGPECNWTFEENGEIRVQWPGGQHTVHLWQSGGDPLRPQTEYALVMRLTPRNQANLHRLLICAGTDTISTFTAAELVFGEESGYLPWFEQAAGSEEALFRIVVEKGVRLGPPVPVWPERLVQWAVEHNQGDRGRARNIWHEAGMAAVRNKKEKDN